MLRYFLGALVMVPTVASAQALDPLDARVELDNVDRFAAIWAASDGKPDAVTLQRDYIDKGDRAIEIFTRGRIEDGANLAATIAENPALYADALDRCLPWVREASPTLRATYLGLSGLLPGRPLPRIAVVIGADNSGGTAGEGMQVLGLEVLCRTSKDRAAFDAQLRKFFAHETVHTLQGRGDDDDNYLLRQTMVEGVADYIASLVTGRPPSAERDAWARPKEAELFQIFAKDVAEVRRLEADPADTTREIMTILRRWHANAGSPPEGWPGELGYWMGRRIAESYVARASDKRVAIDALVDMKDVDAVIAGSDYADLLVR